MTPLSEGMLVQVGDVVGGRYRVDGLIERTENGMVIAATDLMRGGGVAIKLVEPDLEDDIDMLAARIRREADVLAQLTSPHTVRVFGVEQHGDAVCIVMELMLGNNLAQLVKKRGPLPIDEAVGIIVQACDAFAEAHSLGIVHRDVKPQNIFLAARPDGSSVVKVLDFSVSKQHGGSGSMNLTAVGDALGSPLYTAVEQLQNASRVDARADIWSLGLVLYFLLCQKNAYSAENPIALMVKIATSAPAPLRERRPEVPPALEAVILKCVERNRDLRHQNVAELARALVPFGPPWAASFLPSIESRVAGRGSLSTMPPIVAVQIQQAPPSNGPASASAPSSQAPFAPPPSSRAPFPTPATALDDEPQFRNPRLRAVALFGAIFLAVAALTVVAIVVASYFRG